MTRKPRKRPQSFTMPKGVMDEPQAPKQPIANLRGTGENKLFYDLLTGKIVDAHHNKMPEGHVPSFYDWEDDGTMIVRTYAAVGHRPRHGTDFPSRRWWNDPSWVIPAGVKREDIGMGSGTSMVEDGTYDDDVYWYLYREGLL